MSGASDNRNNSASADEMGYFHRLKVSVPVNLSDEPEGLKNADLAVPDN